MFPNMLTGARSNQKLRELRPDSIQHLRNRPGNRFEFGAFGLLRVTLAAAFEVRGWKTVSIQNAKWRICKNIVCAREPSAKKIGPEHPRQGSRQPSSATQESNHLVRLLIILCMQLLSGESACEVPRSLGPLTVRVHEFTQTAKCQSLKNVPCCPVPSASVPAFQHFGNSEPRSHRSIG